jgi:hypothetical protein
MRLLVAAIVSILALAGPAIVSAHGIQSTYQSPLPLVVYLVGAAATVALSFVFVLARDIRAAPSTEGRLVHVPAPIRIALRAIGLIGWLWIVAQGLAGGSSDADVTTLFLFVYGWVGLAALSALVGPVWHWLDPFTTLHDIGASALRRSGVGAWEPAELPAFLRVWPAVIGVFVVVWIELVQRGGPSTLFVTLVGYTAFTLAMMAQYGRDTWRRYGETFSVWFGLLGRLAPFGLVPAVETKRRRQAVDPDAFDDTVVRRRPFASGLLEAEWTPPEVVLVAIGAASILYDGLSQTRPYFDVFGSPQILPGTILLAIFLGVVAAAALLVARLVSPGAIGAGLLPIAVGYLIAHYLTYLLVDGQRIVIAISDPLQTGADLFGTAFFTPVSSFLSPGLTWTIQLAAVVGGHMLGAWAGHVVAQRDGDGRAHEPLEPEPARRDMRLREVPLALVMVALTTVTLWSLGQAIVVTQQPG